MSTEDNVTELITTERLLTPDEVAERLSVGVQWVYGAARRRALPCIRVGRYVRFEEDAIETWIEAQRISS